MTYEGAKANILLEYCVKNSCKDCDNCVFIEALEREIDCSKPKGNDCDFMFIDEVIAYDTQKED